MQLARVDVTQDAYLCMLSHALSTEHEEVMGLLCGDTSYGPDAELLCTVWSTAPQSRSDRRRDRVETTPEQLAATSQAAERASAATGTTTRVIGWYHSHPHITVLPSAVDLRTQANFQQLEDGFVGLIFSVFDQDRDKVGRVQVVAFQTDVSGPSVADIRPPNAWGLPSAPTASSGASSGGLTRRLVPMRIVPSQQHPAWPHRLAPLLDLQRTLLAEEAKTYAAAQAAATEESSSASAVAGAAAAAMHQCHLCALLGHSLAPMLRALSGRLAQSTHQLAQLSADAHGNDASAAVATQPGAPDLKRC